MVDLLVMKLDEPKSKEEMGKELLREEENPEIEAKSKNPQTQSTYQLSFSAKDKRENDNFQFQKFLNIFKNLHINIHLINIIL